MTFQRYLYKLFWKKLGVPLVIGCGLIALIATFYRHSYDKSALVVTKDVSERHLSSNVNIDNKVRSVSEKHIRQSVSVKIPEEQLWLKPHTAKKSQENKFKKKLSEQLIKHNEDKTKDEIDLDKRLFDNLREPHIHIQGGIVRIKQPDLNDTLPKSVAMNTVLEPHFDVLRHNVSDSKLRPKSNHTLTFKKQPLKIFERTPNLDNQDKMLRNISKFTSLARKSKYELGVNNFPNEQRQTSDMTVMKRNVSKPEIQNVMAVRGEIKHSSNNNTQKPASTSQTTVSSITVKSTTEQMEYIAENEPQGVGEADYEDSFLPADLSPIPDVHPHRRSSLYYNPLNPPLMFREWQSDVTSQCDSKFTAYSHEFVSLKNVIVDKSKFEGPVGGENIKDVLNQEENIEYLRYDMGCFQLKCKNRLEYYFNDGHHLSEYLFNVQISGVNTKDYKKKVAEFTIAVTRYEYANLYHTMTDWYNAFLVMNFFNKTQDQTSVLLIDAHPKGALDGTWKFLFKTVERISDLNSRTNYAQMAWNMLGYNSPLLRHYLDEIPLTEEFREFFLNSFGIKTDKTLNCGKLNILFIWRRNYLAHPRNPKGIISRKVRNEKNLMRAVKRRYREHHISGIQIDLFSMQQQLKLISETDVLIGMHGAGLTHGMFLPKHAGIIELVPSYWTVMDHFLAIAKWRGLWYERWVNLNQYIEIMDQTTRVPPAVVTALLKTVLRKMECIKPLEENS